MNAPNKIASKYLKQTLTEITEIQGEIDNYTLYRENFLTDQAEKTLGKDKENFHNTMNKPTLVTHIVVNPRLGNIPSFQRPVGFMKNDHI